MTINSVCITGRLTKDPIIRKTANDKSVASFSIAVDKPTKSGETSEVSFFDCVAWGLAADWIASDCSKGTKIAINGRLDQRRYTDKNGNNRSTVEIIVDRYDAMTSKASRNTAAPASQSVYTKDMGSSMNDQDYDEGMMIDDDSLPF